jgi:hypothetical protein
MIRSNDHLQRAMDVFCSGFFVLLAVTVFFPCGQTLMHYFMRRGHRHE